MNPCNPDGLQLWPNLIRRPAPFICMLPFWIQGIYPSWFKLFPSKTSSDTLCVSSLFDLCPRLAAFRSTGVTSAFNRLNEHHHSCPKFPSTDCANGGGQKSCKPLRHLWKEKPSGTFHVWQCPCVRYPEHGQRGAQHQRLPVLHHHCQGPRSGKAAVLFDIKRS